MLVYFSKSQLALVPNEHFMAHCCLGHCIVLYNLSVRYYTLRLYRFVFIFKVQETFDNAPKGTFGPERFCFLL